MPRVATLPGARILERLELQASGGQSRFRPVGEQERTVGGYQVRHRPPFPEMPVQPEAAVHGVDHPLASRRELAVNRVTLHAWNVLMR